MDKKDMLNAAMRQCAVDFNCAAGDFIREDTVIVTPLQREGRRHFISGNFFLRMATFGSNAVIAADARIHPWLRSYVENKIGH